MTLLKFVQTSIKQAQHQCTSLITMTHHHHHQHLHDDNHNHDDHNSDTISQCKNWHNTKGMGDTIHRVRIGFKQQDPNDGVTVIWVLGIKTHPSWVHCMCFFFMSPPQPCHTTTKCSVRWTGWTGCLEVQMALESQECLEPLVLFLFSFYNTN